MALIQWDRSLSVGVTQFDNEHKKLIEMINTLHTAMQERKSKEVIGDLLVGLAKYTDYHFSREEDQMAKYNYPDLPKQKKQHKEFVGKIEEYIKQHDSGNIILSIDIMNFLLNWLKTHIKNTDMAYTEFFHAKGVK